MIMIPFLDLAASTRELRPALDDAYRRVMESGWFVLGPEVEAFEQALAAHVGVRHCVGVGNGLEALQLVLTAWGIGPGDEVIVPSHTFIATWLAVAFTGARPVPVDPPPAATNIAAPEIERALTARTRAIVPVHLYGRPAEMTDIVGLARQAGVRVLEDAAQAHGARHRGRNAGALGDAAAFSFYPGKNLGAFGDGGAITTDDDDLAARLRMLRNYGSRQKYHHETVGHNSRLDEMQAAFLRVKLCALDEWNTRRRRVAARYLEGLRDVPEIERPSPDDANESSWHLFVIQSPRRDALAQYLRIRGIETLIHYPIPPHRSEAFAPALADQEFPRADHLARSVLSLPMGPHLSDDQVDTVIAAVRSFLGAA